MLSVTKGLKDTNTRVCRLRRIRKPHDTVIDFASNDTLGLSKDKRVTQALSQGAQKWGVGSTGSPIVCGSTQAHTALEQSLAGALGFEAGLCFSSGYQANLAIAAFLKTKHLAIDHHMHASIWDGLKDHQSKWFRYKTPEQIEKRQTDFILTEGVFSQSGRVAELATLLEVAKKKQSSLVLDDAHGIGVIGEKGLGTLSSFKLVGADIFAAVIPMGKALGCQGAVVLGQCDFIEALQSSRSWIYSTALSPAIACAALKAFEIIQAEEWRREKLHSNIADFKSLCAQARIRLLPSQTPIQSIVINDTQPVMLIQEKLIQKGFFVGTMQPPSVKKPILRCVISCKHQVHEIRLLTQVLSDV